MKRSDIWRVVAVMGLLAPLVWFQAGAGYAPSWLSMRLGGVPLTVCATVAWFIAMMLLTWHFARRTNGQAS